jgi:hypothetical protein
VPRQASIDRRKGRWPNLILVHLPVHASWLNQVEIYHSIIQRKLLDPNDFESTAELARALNEFERRYNEIARPFAWDFTRQDLAELLAASTSPHPNSVAVLVGEVDLDQDLELVSHRHRIELPARPKQVKGPHG